MEYRNLGAAGLKVSELCLGTMTFGHGADASESKRLVEVAMDAGVNFFDTANSYAGSQAEQILGAALAGRRHEAIVATKAFNPMGPGPNDSGSSRAHIMTAVEDSLRRLGTDYIDIYYLHHVDEQTPIEESLRALDDLVRQGKVRYTGCCNYQGYRLMEAIWLADANGLARFACYQGQYNLVVRDIEPEIAPACRMKGLGIVAWAPLAGGFLTGKYKPGERQVEGSRSAEGWAYPEPFFAASADETLAELLTVAGNVAHSPAQVALRWLLARPGVTAAIVGARTVAQLEDNLGAATFRLEPDALRRLDDVSRQRVPYPEGMERFAGRRRARAVRDSDSAGD